MACLISIYRDHVARWQELTQIVCEVGAGSIEYMYMYAGSWLVAG